MPVVGTFHGFYWRTRANPVVPPGASSGWMYPGTQSGVVTLMSMAGWISLEPLRPWWRRVCAVWAIARKLWRLSDRDRAQVTIWLTRLERTPAEDLAVYEQLAAIMAGPWDRPRVTTWLDRLHKASPDHLAVYERVAAIMESSWWSEAQSRVRACATTPKFHQPEQWVEYGRALKANAGQAQNVFRHIKVVHELRALADEQQLTLSNPEAHLVAELAYQAMAATDTRQRQIVVHPVLSQPL